MTIINNITLKEVKQGKYSPQEYFDYLTESVKEIKEAKNSGMLLGIVYLDPLEEKEGLEILWKELWGKLLNQEEWQKVSKQMKWKKNYLEEALEQALERLLRDHSERPLILFSVASHTFVGQKLPGYIFGYPAIFRTKKDEDIRKSLGHELHHLEDNYLGIKIGSHCISRENFINEEMDFEFYAHLHELRAYHQDLYEIFSKKQGDVKSYSSSYLHNVVEKYFNNYSCILKIASTPFEKKIAKAQLKEYQDIVPEKLSKAELKKSGAPKGFIIEIDIREKPIFLTILSE